MRSDRQAYSAVAAGMIDRTRSSKIPGTNSKEFKTNPMKSKFTCFLLAAVFALSLTALAQAASDAALPAAPSAASLPPPPVTTSATGTEGGNDQYRAGHLRQQRRPA